MTDSGKRRESKPRVSKTDYRPFPELVITGDRYRIYAWVEAAHEFKYGHPQPLATMLLSRSRVPEFVRALLADYVTGKLKIQSKGASHQKLSLNDRMRVRFHHGIQSKRHAGEHGTLKSVHEIAAEEGKEPIEIRQRLAKAERDFEAAWAKRYGVSPRTIHNIIKPLVPKRK